MFGRRVPKTDARLEAVGTCDELNAALGMVRAFCEDASVVDAVFGIQKELVILMGELSVPVEDRERYRADGFDFVDARMVERLTARIDDLEQNHRLNYKHWATPGATKASACLDLARTVCRRAERTVVALQEIGAIPNGEIVRYLNRLSDLCWLYARWVETGVEESGIPGLTTRPSS